MKTLHIYFYTNEHMSTLHLKEIENAQENLVYLNTNFKWTWKLCIYNKTEEKHAKTSHPSLPLTLWRRPRRSPGWTCPSTTLRRSPTTSLSEQDLEFHSSHFLIIWILKGPS